mmetsp:Transcript_3440/g.4571  ORF Transcript_3440/g.4571 Transcript_3440/m.4571 type:complete len:233 (-) Transcript_3440:211-909(-)
MNGVMKLLWLLLYINSLYGGVAGFSATPPPGDVSLAREQIGEIISRNNANNNLDLNDSALGQCIDNLIAKAKPENKVFDPTAVAGTWQVVHAPHLAFLSNLALSKLRPVQYYLTKDMKMSSSVRYNSFIFGYGWLSTAGYYNISPGNKNVNIIWDKVWWNPEYLERPTPPEDGFLPGLIQTLGIVGFSEPLSVFPVAYVDESIVTFNFLGVKITATKVKDPLPALYVKAEDQ